MVGWTLEGPASDDHSLKLQIALRQGDVEAFEKRALDIATPGHPHYGQHFQSYEEMKRMLMPRDDTVSLVSSWLKTSGIGNFELNSDWMTFTTTVGVANKLLNTHFSWFTSNDVPPRKIIRTLEYSVPDEVASHINLIQPTTRFEAFRTAGRIVQAMDQVSGDALVPSGPSGVTRVNCDQSILPYCLKDLYQVYYTPDPKSGSKVGFASFLGQNARYRDLAQFEDIVLQGATSQNVTKVLFNGAINDQSSTADSTEANLDVQYIVDMAHPLPVTEYITDGLGPFIPNPFEPNQSYNQDEPYLEFLHSILKLPQEDLPQVLSTSYAENEENVPKSYALSVCNLYAQLGSRGVSVIFASGDLGPGAIFESNDGKKTPKFQPIYPATCPWVTSVGSTTYLNQTATSFSSGGFSNYWARPSYQDHAIHQYLKHLGQKNSQYFNASGRGSPDVSAQGINFVVYDKGKWTYQFGTSASAPTVAGIIALLNDARLRAKQAPLGFLNPLLYAHPHTLNDVVLGGSKGCDGTRPFTGVPNGTPVIPYAGWNATVG